MQFGLVAVGLVIGLVGLLDGVHAIVTFDNQNMTNHNTTDRDFTGIHITKVNGVRIYQRVVNGTITKSGPTYADVCDDNNNTRNVTRTQNIGTRFIRNSDGSQTIIYKNGTVVLMDHEKITTRYPNGTVVITVKKRDGDVRTVADSFGSNDGGAKATTKPETEPVGKIDTPVGNGAHIVFGRDGYINIVISSIIAAAALHL